MMPLLGNTATNEAADSGYIGVNDGHHERISVDQFSINSVREIKLGNTKKKEILEFHEDDVLTSWEEPAILHTLSTFATPTCLSKDESNVDGTSEKIRHVPNPNGTYSSETYDVWNSNTEVKQTVQEDDATFDSEVHIQEDHFQTSDVIKLLSFCDGEPGKHHSITGKPQQKHDSSKGKKFQDFDSFNQVRKKNDKENNRQTSAENMLASKQLLFGQSSCHKEPGKNLTTPGTAQYLGSKDQSCTDYTTNITMDTQGSIWLSACNKSFSGCIGSNRWERNGVGVALAKDNTDEFLNDKYILHVSGDCCIMQIKNLTEDDFDSKYSFHLGFIHIADFHPDSSPIFPKSNPPKWTCDQTNENGVLDFKVNHRNKNEEIVIETGGTHIEKIKTVEKGLIYESALNIEFRNTSSNSSLKILFYDRMLNEYVTIFEKTDIQCQESDVPEDQGKEEKDTPVEIIIGVIVALGLAVVVVGVLLYKLRKRQQAIRGTGEEHEMKKLTNGVGANTEGSDEVKEDDQACNDCGANLLNGSPSGQNGSMM